VNKNKPAVLLLIFNRPELTQKVFNVIRKVKPKKLFIAADGPRLGNQNDIIDCKKTREIKNQVDWNCNVYTLFREENLGCRLAISSGISWFFDHVDEGIILEDDCLPSVSFFSFSQELLEKYRFENRVMQINGSFHLSSIKNYTESYYFSKLNSCWGWATWKRAWKYFDSDMSEYIDFKKNNRIHEYYEFKEISDWMISYLDEAYRPSCQIWSTKWAFSILKNNGLCVNPTVNLVNNIGFLDSPTSGVHESFLAYSNYDLEDIASLIHPTDILYDAENDLLEFENVIKITDPRLINKGFINDIRSFVTRAIRFVLRRFLKLQT